jgi:16S rRNA G966 N2-methylase RsmD
VSRADLTLFDELPRPNGEANRVDPSDAPFHEWYRFVLSFPPHLVRDYLKRFHLSESATLLDPFCGTGTALVECQRRGLRAVGVEALPMPAFASRVKTSWSVDPEKLRSHAASVANRASEILESQGVPDDPEFAVTAAPEALRGLPSDAMRLLLRDSVSPIPLHKTLILLDAIRQGAPHPFLDYELLALAKALVSSIGNLRFGPEVGLGNVKENAPVLMPWLSLVNRMVSDLRAVQGTTWHQAVVAQADSRNLASILPPASVDAVFTSPPYPNEKDYTRTTRLETVILGFAQTMGDLRQLKKSLVRSNTRSVYKTDTDDHLLQSVTVEKIAHEIEKRRIRMGKTSGFERLYHRVTRLYFGGMKHHLSALRPILRPGAFLGYVVLHAPQGAARLLPPRQEAARRDQSPHLRLGA